MALRSVEYDASELFALANSMKGAKRIVTQETTKALTKGGKLVEAQAKQNLQANGSLASGALMTGFVMKVSAYVLIVTNTRPYAINVEEGRKPGGKMPPSDAIAAWMAIKGIAPELNFVIRRGIAKHGIPPKPFMGPAFDHSLPTLLKLIEAATVAASQRIVGLQGTGIPRK
jgi:hypothetical protein